MIATSDNDVRYGIIWLSFILSFAGIKYFSFALRLTYPPIYKSNQMNFTGNDTIARFPTFMRAYLNIPHKSSNRTNFQSRFIISRKKKLSKPAETYHLFIIRNIPRCIQQVVRKGEQRLLRCRAFPPFYQPTYP